jgi:uridine kinase
VATRSADLVDGSDDGEDEILQRFTRRVGRLTAGRDAPLLVALDGRSGAGKSTLAASVAARLPSCVVIGGDDFYAGGTPQQWDTRSAAEKVAMVIDWTRQRPVLSELKDQRTASWHGYDWEAFDGRLDVQATVCDPADVVILEGAYSARPELADLLDLRVLLATDDAVRHERLGRREGWFYRDQWFSRWSEAEDYYFGLVMPADAFDLVL